MIPAVPFFHQNAVLFGHGATPRLVAFELAGEDTVRVFVWAADGRIITDLKTFRPFMLLASMDLVTGWGGGYDVEALQGGR